MSPYLSSTSALLAQIGGLGRLGHAGLPGLWVLLRELTEDKRIDTTEEVA